MARRRPSRELPWDHKKLDGHGLVPIAVTKAVSRPKGQAHDSVQQCATVGNFETFGGSSQRGPVMRGPLEYD